MYTRTELINTIKYKHICNLSFISRGGIDTVWITVALTLLDRTLLMPIPFFNYVCRVAAVPAEIRPT